MVDHDDEQHKALLDVREAGANVAKLIDKKGDLNLTRSIVTEGSVLHS